MSTPAPHDPTCIFCKIVSGQIPCFKIFEDESVLSFLDVGPLMTGHALVIPKGHYSSVLTIPAEEIAKVTARIPAIAKAVLAATGHEACHLLANSGAEAMQSVSHLHFHILPRWEGDAFRITWNAGAIDRTAGVVLAEKIRQGLAS